MILFRVEASPSIGAGHLVRCLALAEELGRRGFDCAFWSPGTPEPYLAWIRDGGHTLLDEPGQAPAGGPSEPFAWVIADDYNIDATLIRDLRSAGSKVIVIDDLADRRLPATILVNPNPWARAADYTALAPPETRLLLGTRFAPVRRAFTDSRWSRAEEIGPAERVLVALGGGSNRGGVIAIVLDGVRNALPDVCVDLVVGPANSRDPAEDMATTVYRSASSSELAKLMSQADFAIGGAGTMSWERCVVGVPSVVLALADNQVPVARSLSAAGAAIDAGAIGERTLEAISSAAARLQSSELRAAMSVRARSLVDGRGARRIANLVDGVRVRRATADDAELLWTWANDPVTRAYSLNSDPINWTDHMDWLGRKLNDTGTMLLIGQNECGSVGQVRFDLGADVEVSISIAPEHRDELLGELLLEAAVRSLVASHRPRAVVARVRAENSASRRLFERSGFELRENLGTVLRYERRLGLA